MTCRFLDMSSLRKPAAVVLVHSLAAANLGNSEVLASHRAPLGAAVSIPGLGQTRGFLSRLMPEGIR